MKFLHLSLNDCHPGLCSLLVSPKHIYIQNKNIFVNTLVDHNFGSQISKVVVWNESGDYENKKFFKKKELYGFWNVLKY